MANISKTENEFSLVSKEIDAKILAVVSNNVQGFEKAFVTSSAIGFLREKLSPEYMQPIMALQGSRLGFLTDKDIDPKTKQKGTGYPENVVKDCVIDAVLLGLEVTGNQFNIIGGNMYPTREGFGSLLDKMTGLRKNFTYKNIVQHPGSKTANVVVQIDWQFNEETAKKQVIDFPIKSSDYTSYDALVGKAERKAKRWLYNTIKGSDISDGDVSDIPHIVVNDYEDRFKVLSELYDSSQGLTEDENTDIKRVIDNKETASYDKAIKFLTAKLPANE